MQGGMGGKSGPMSFGKSKAKMLDGGKVKTSFADVAGIEVQSESRIGGSDFGVNADRLDDIEDFLESYDFKTTCQ